MIWQWRLPVICIEAFFDSNLTGLLSYLYAETIEKFGAYPDEGGAMLFNIATMNKSARCPGRPGYSVGRPEMR